MDGEGCFSVGIIIFAIALIIILPFVHLSSVGNGQHTGYVTAVDYRGYIFPNYEVYFKTDVSSSQEDVYCVSRDDKTIADELKKAAKTKERVTISYYGVKALGIGICSGTRINEVVKD
jgi:hypothetical protein